MLRLCCREKKTISCGSYSKRLSLFVLLLYVVLHLICTNTPVAVVVSVCCCCCCCCCWCFFFSLLACHGFVYCCLQSLICLEEWLAMRMGRFHKFSKTQDFLGELWKECYRIDFASKQIAGSVSTLCNPPYYT